MKITPQTDNPNLPTVHTPVEPTNIHDLKSDAPTTTTHHSSTSHVSGSNDVAPASVPSCMSLSPDALMAYCESRLNSLDTQMSTIFKTQQKNAQVTQDLNTISGSIGDLATNSSSSSSSTLTATPKQYTQILNEYAAAIKDAGAKTPLGISLSKDQAAFEAACGKGEKNALGNISSDKISTLTQSLKNDSDNLNSDSQMVMINLQSLMSQRETAVQLTTNLVQSLGQQSSDIAKNVGN